MYSLCIQKYKIITTLMRGNYYLLFIKIAITQVLFYFNE